MFENNIIGVYNTKKSIGVCYFVADMNVLMNDVDFVKQFDEKAKNVQMELLKNRRNFLLRNKKNVQNNCSMGSNNKPLTDNEFYELVNAMCNYENSVFAWVRRFINCYYGLGRLYQNMEDIDRGILLEIIMARLHYLMNNNDTVLHKFIENEKQKVLNIFRQPINRNKGYVSVLCSLYSNYGYNPGSGNVDGCISSKNNNNISFKVTYESQDKYSNNISEFTDNYIEETNVPTNNMTNLMSMYYNMLSNIHKSKADGKNYNFKPTGIALKYIASSHAFENLIMLLKCLEVDTMSVDDNNSLTASSLLEKSMFYNCANICRLTLHNERHSNRYVVKSDDVINLNIANYKKGDLYNIMNNSLKKSASVFDKNICKDMYIIEYNINNKTIKNSLTHNLLSNVIRILILNIIICIYVPHMRMFAKKLNSETQNDDNGSNNNDSVNMENLESIVGRIISIITEFEKHIMLGYSYSTNMSILRNVLSNYQNKDTAERYIKLCGDFSKNVLLCKNYITEGFIENHAGWKQIFDDSYKTIDNVLIIMKDVFKINFENINSEVINKYISKLKNTDASYNQKDININVMMIIILIITKYKGKNDGNVLRSIDILDNVCNYDENNDEYSLYIDQLALTLIELVGNHQSKDFYDYFLTNGAIENFKNLSNDIPSITDIKVNNNVSLSLQLQSIYVHILDSPGHVYTINRTNDKYSMFAQLQVYNYNNYAYDKRQGENIYEKYLYKPNRNCSYRYVFVYKPTCNNLPNNNNEINKSNGMNSNNNSINGVMNGIENIVAK